MAIDTFTDSLLSLDDAAKHCEKISGTQRNRAVLVRWANRGVAGVRLEIIQIGKKLYTSQSALNEFFMASRAAKTEKHSSRTAAGIRRAKLHKSNPDLERDLDSDLQHLGIVSK